MGEQGAITITPEGEVRTGILPDGGAENPRARATVSWAVSSAGLADGLSVRDAVLQGSARRGDGRGARGLRPGNARPRQSSTKFIKSHKGPSAA